MIGDFENWGENLLSSKDLNAPSIDYNWLSVEFLSSSSYLATITISLFRPIDFLRPFELSIKQLINPIKRVPDARHPKTT